MSKSVVIACIMLYVVGCAHIVKMGDVQDICPVSPSYSNDLVITNSFNVEYSARTDTCDEYITKYALLSSPLVTVEGISHSVKYLRVEISIPIIRNIDGAGKSYTIKTNCPTIICRPISSKSYLLERWNRDYFVRAGYAFVLIYHDFNSRRYETDLVNFLNGDFYKRKRLQRPDQSARERKIKEQDIRDANPVNINLLMWQAVIDTHGVINWATTLEEVDSDKIGLIAFSLGAIQSCAVVATHPRIKVAVLGLSGGDLPYILTKSEKDNIVRGRESYMSSFREHPITIDDYRLELADKIKWDPKLFAPSIQVPVMYILASLDKTVPYRSGLMLYELTPKAEMFQILSGHYSSVLYLPYLQRKSLMFLDKHLRD